MTPSEEIKVFLLFSNVNTLSLSCARKPESSSNLTKVAWFMEGGDILVTHQCLVKFYIDKDRDEVRCDVVPLEVCHILLGRPWQYDRKPI